MSYGDSFCEHFLKAYRECRESFDRKRWEEIWNDKDEWNHFMLWNSEPPQTESVIPFTARRMGLLSRRQGETFHLDSVFYPSEHRMVGKYPLPIIVACEHEHEPRGFWEEILKLAYIRCPLKVGLTYLNGTSPSKEAVAAAQKRISDLTSATEHTLREYAAEDPKVEYVYLLGVERQSLELEWHALRFTARDGAASAKWVPLS
jgi:hypothetical protein